MAILFMLLLLPLLLVASGFFSGSETALFSLSRHQRTQLARSKRLADQTISTLLAETRGLLITLLLCNMTVNVLFFVISSVLLIQLNKRGISGVWITFASVLPLLTIILLGEVLPKLVAARLTLQWNRVTAVPLFVVHRVITPVRITASLLIIAPLARLIAPPSKPAALSADELESLLTLSQKQGVIDPDEEHLLQQVLELSQLKVRDLMVPRVDMVAFDLANEPADLVALIQQAKLSHIPVYHDKLDQIVGLVYSRQVLLNPPTTRKQLDKLIRQVKFVPELQRADQLLVELRKTSTTLAIVVDEYGGTAGLITIEDVVEHMVGDIAGPYETQGQPRLESLRPGAWRVGGELSVHDWADLFGHNAAVEGLAALEAVSTVGGLVMARLGRVPKPGDTTTVGNVQITVEHMHEMRVDTVIIELRNAAASKPTEAKA